MRRAQWKRKNVRRVGLRQRRPPAAGGGWLAVPCSSQGRKRPALGETSSPGKYRDTLSLPPRCRSRSREEQPAAAKRKAGPYDNHPIDVSSTGTGQQLGEPQKTQACPKARQNRRLHRYADPRRARRATAPERAQRPFLLDRARPVFFSGKTEKKMGGASPLDKPPGGSRHPRGRRPAARTPPGVPLWGSFFGYLRPQAAPRLPDVSPGESPAE